MVMVGGNVMVRDGGGGGNVMVRDGGGVWGDNDAVTTSHKIPPNNRMLTTHELLVIDTQPRTHAH